MDKDKEVECALRLDIFNTYWNILKSNYQDTRHTEFDFKYYWSIFREYQEKDFIKAIKLVLKYQPYFPRVDEIVKYLPDDIEENDVPKWFDKELKVEEITEGEQEELEKILEEIGG